MNLLYRLGLLQRRLPAWLSRSHLATALSYLREPDAYRFFGQFGEDAVLQRYFASRAWREHGRPVIPDRGFYVDIGAFHPSQYSNTYWFYKHGWRGINIDPTPGTKALFDRRRPRDLNLELAISDRDGETTLSTFGHPCVVNTLSEAHAAEWSARLGEPTSVVVPCRTLASVLADAVPQGVAIDFLSVDCEAWDETVLRSNDWDRFRPELVVAEVHATQVDALLDRPIHRFLSDVGYHMFAWVQPSVLYTRVAL